MPSPESGRLRVLAVLGGEADVGALEATGLTPTASMGRVVSLLVGPDDLDRLLAFSGLVSVRLPQRFRANLDVNGAENGAVAARLAGASGRGVLVALVDSGIDFRHGDFRRADGHTRIKSLWDQLDQSYQGSGGTIGSAPPMDQSGTPLGTLYTESQINAALDGTGVVNSVDLVGHGTLAASAAAGNGRATGNGQPAGVYVGTAPEASLLVVRIGGQNKTDLNFPGDVIAALQWIDQRATELAMPVVVNLSFGGHIGPHDGTTPEEMAIDAFVQKPGRAVVVAAGNEGDIDIHASGSALGSHTLQVFQAGEDAFLLVDCWMASGDVVDLGFTDPPGRGVADLNVTAGNCAGVVGPPNKITACVGDPDPDNQEREVLFFVEPSTTLAPISAGRWNFDLRDEGGVQNGHFDCWSALGQQFVADVDGGARVSHPGTARGAVTVGALTARDRWPSMKGQGKIDAMVGAIAPFSSPGPTRDGRLKPDLVTGGYAILGAWSIGDGTGSGLAGVPPRSDLVASDGVHVASSGTSFSTPQVTGAVALLLERNPQLDAEELKTILISTARSDDFTGTVPNDQWGHGKMDVAAAVQAVATPTPVVSFPGDSNCDAAIDEADRDATITAFFDRRVGCSADCNRDGRVDSADLICVASAATAR